MRLRIVRHEPGRLLVVAARGGPLPALAAAAGLACVPGVLALQALGGPVPSPGVELPLLVALGALARARGVAREGTQEVVLRDGDALVRRGPRRWRLPAHAIHGAALLEAPARLALAVRLPDSPALAVAGGWATVLETPWDSWARAGALHGQLRVALARLGLTLLR